MFATTSLHHVTMPTAARRIVSNWFSRKVRVVPAVFACFCVLMFWEVCWVREAFLFVLESDVTIVSTTPCSSEVFGNDRLTNSQKTWWQYHLNRHSVELDSEFQLGFQLPCLAANDWFKLPVKRFCWKSSLEMWELIAGLMKMTSFVLTIWNFLGSHLVRTIADPFNLFFSI